MKLFWYNTQKKKSSMTAEFDIFFEYIMQVLYYCADISGSLFTYLFIHLLIFFI